MAKVQHKNLPNNLLHEPKGASTATKGTVYVADGAGSGSFTKIPVTSLDITPDTVATLTDNITEVITDGTIDNITNTIVVDGSDLTQAPSGVLVNLPYIPNILPVDFSNNLNKNFSELFAVYTNATTINSQLKKNIKEIVVKLDEVLAAIKAVGVVN